MHVGHFFTNSSICVGGLLATTLTLQLGGNTSECLDGPGGSCGVSRVAGSRVLLSWIGIVEGHHNGEVMAGLPIIPTDPVSLWPSIAQ